MTLNAVLDLAAQGQALFPVDHPDRVTCAGMHRPDAPCDGERGKHPAVKWGLGATSDPERLVRMFRRGPLNAGVSCGPSGLVVLDEDRHGELARAAADAGEPVPVTFTVATGRGFHLWFRQPEGLPFANGKGRFASYKIDVRGRGGYVLAPGSQHASGRRYEVVDPSAPIGAVPAWVADWLRWTPPAPPRTRIVPAVGQPASQASVDGVLTFILGATPDVDRNSRLFWGSLRLWERVRDGQLTAAAAVAMLADAGSAIRLSTGEIRATVTSARRTVLGG